MEKENQAEINSISGGEMTTQSSISAEREGVIIPHLSRRSVNIRSFQNYLVLWLDIHNDEANDECRDAMNQLQQVINTIYTFNDTDRCIDYLTDTKNEKALLILSSKLGWNIVPIIHDICQIDSIYILSDNKAEQEQRTTQWSKVKDIFTEVTPICAALKQAVRKYDQNNISISFVPLNNLLFRQNLDQLDSSFMYTQILKEILLEIDFEEKHVKDFTAYCHEHLQENPAVTKLEQEYRQHTPIWWYTGDFFLYPILNRALRLMEVDIIIKMGFFVNDLHRQIIQLHSKQFGAEHQTHILTVYRGQGLSMVDFDQLLKTKGGLISFNNFLSTSTDRAVSFAFAESNQNNLDMTGVLFQIVIDPLVRSTHFASISEVSYYRGEEEVLFSMHSVFRVGQIRQIENNNRLWQVELTLTSDDDPQLHTLTEWIREGITGYTGWERLGYLLIDISQYDKAEELYHVLLDQTNDANNIGYYYHNLGLIKANQGDYEEALSFYKKSIEIRSKTLPPNDLNLAISYTNIGSLYNHLGEYSKALSLHRKALEIGQKTVPPHYSQLATSCSNIGSVYKAMGEYSKALLFYEKALEIKEKTLPPNHPSLATSYNNVGGVCCQTGEYSKALLHYEKVLDINQKTLPPNHSNLPISFSNIGELYVKMGDYAKAASHHEKALEISEKILPPDHPGLAISYNNVGGMYDNMREHSKALLYYEKALDINRKILPPKHPHLAGSYNNIGKVYNDIGDYLKALMFHEKALKIKQNTLPPNHPDLAISYNNIALVHNNLGNYTEALALFERAYDILQCSLASTHPLLQIVLKGIETVKKKF